MCTECCSTSRHWHTHHSLSHLLHAGIALARRPRMYSQQTGSHCAPLSAEQGPRVPGRLLYTSLRHSQPTSFTVSYSTSPDCTKLPAQHFRSSGLLCCRSDGLELATGQSPWPGARQQQLQTIAENEPISLLPLSTHSAVEMLHDSALYKSIIDTDNDITFTKFYRNKTTWQRTSNFSKSWQKTAHRDKDLLTETTYQLCWPLVTVE